MTITIELPPDVEAKLQERAARQGQPAETVAGEILRQELLPDGKGRAADTETPPEGQSLAEALKDYIGKYHSGKGDLSENTAEKFTDYLVEKRRQGHL